MGNRPKIRFDDVLTHTLATEWHGPRIDPLIFGLGLAEAKQLLRLALSDSTISLE